MLLYYIHCLEEMSIDVDKDKRAKYWEQVENGMWMRVALIMNIFNVNDNILLNK